MTKETLKVEQFADMLLSKAHNKELFTVEFATDIEPNGNPCAWLYATHIINSGTGTDCILFDTFGGGEAFAVNVCVDYDRDELIYQLLLRDIFEIFAYEEK